MISKRSDFPSTGFGAKRPFFLAKHPQWDRVPFFDTAASAAEVSMNLKNNKAAITSEYAASVYGLQVLEKNIADNFNNATRFVVLEKGMDKCDVKADKDKSYRCC